MDIAKKFKPDTILLWQKAADNFETQRILKMFPSAQIRLIENQKFQFAGISAGQALLKGKKTLMIGHASSFVGHFDGQLGEKVHCCPYYKLVPVSNGCPYFCTYCYLAFVYRNYSPFVKLNINYETMLRQIEKISSGAPCKISFNMGEMLDSLALDHVSNLTSILVPYFSRLENSFLMLLTKSSNIDNLLKEKPNSQVVVSWSINSQQIIKDFETGTAELDERIYAAKKCQEHGYRIRFRIDPGIIYEDWQNGYAEAIQKIFSFTRPENITLGMLRFLPGHFNLAKQAYGQRAEKLFNLHFVKGATDGKLRYNPEQRINFYKFLIETIRNFDKKVSISLCRETPDVWTTLKHLCEPQKCNCIIW